MSNYKVITIERFTSSGGNKTCGCIDDLSEGCRFARLQNVHASDIGRFTQLDTVQTAVCVMGDVQVLNVDADTFLIPKTDCEVWSE
jgi:hypothetical protein